MLSLLIPLAAGNAVQGRITPPVDALHWRVLRKQTDDIAAHNDAAARVVCEGTDAAFVDIGALKNNQAYFYRPFYWNGAEWVPGESVAVTPAVLFSDVSVNVIELLRERIDLGLAHYVARGKLQHAKGRIPVMNATPTYEGTTFPVVSVILSSDGVAEDFVGGVVGGEVSNPDGSVSEFFGHMSRYQIDITAFTPNSDVRAALRMAIKAVMSANRSIFEENQITQMEISYSDQDDFQTYAEPMFMVRGAFSCLAPTAIRVDSAGVITEVLSTATF